jgi:hypothetical protein
MQFVGRDLFGHAKLRLGHYRGKQSDAFDLGSQRARLVGTGPRLRGDVCMRGGHLEHFAVTLGRRARGANSMIQAPTCLYEERLKPHQQRGGAR